MRNPPAPVEGQAARKPDVGVDGRDAATCSIFRPPAQAASPIERHDPLPADKLALFEIAPAHRLVGRWQGPGSISELVHDRAAFVRRRYATAIQRGDHGTADRLRRLLDLELNGRPAP